MGQSFRILGPLEVYGPAGAVPIAAHRQKVVLATLLLNTGRVVSTSRLIEALWDGAPPSTARDQVQICVSALRRHLRAAGRTGALMTRAPGYVLCLPPDDLDLATFDRIEVAARALAREDRLDEAADLWHQALTLWRGEPLAELDSGVIRAAAVGLAERRVAATEEAIDVRLRLGEHRELVGVLMELVAAQPLRERPRGQLMTALNRSGRRAEALETYRCGRDLMVEELGLEPGEELRNLEGEILRGTDGTAPAPVRRTMVAPRPGGVRPWMVPADIADFTGRIALLDRVRTSLAQPDGDAAYLTAISGPPGVGKTALAVRAAHLMREAFPDGELFASLGAHEGGEPEAVLHRFLVALGVTDIPDTLEARAELYRSRMAGRRMLVVLDDAALESQVTPLLPGTPGTAVLVTGRPRLTGLPGAVHVDVGLMGTDQAVELIGSVVGQERVAAELSTTRRLAVLCAGLPLAVRIVGARLASRPHWTIKQLVDRLRDERHRLDELAHHDLAVRTSLAVSYEGLDEPAKVLFRRLGTIETAEFMGRVAGPLLGLEAARAEEILDNLVDARLLEARRTDGHSVRFRFHDLTRLYARDLATVDA